MDFLYIGVAAATAPWWARKARGGWAERFGRIQPLPPVPEGGRVMVHGVSVGEIQALRRLVPMLSQEWGRDGVLVTAGTDTGLARAEQLYSEMCHIRRYPLDASGAVRRFLDTAKPTAVALVELELWPHFVGACGQRGVPVGVINGRLSERSFKGYKKLRRWIGPVFRSLEFAAVQDEAYAERFEAMGVDPGRCLLTGSMKWDAVRAERTGDPSPAALALAEEMGLPSDRAIVVGGSTGPGEEALLHEACPEGAVLVCAPRRPERFDEAAAALPGCVRRSSGEPQAGDRYLLDTIGELSTLYELADVVVVGRSFGDLHGSDPTEPAALGKPVLIGPRSGDFRSIVQALEAAKALETVGRERLGAALDGLIGDPAARHAMGEAGRACVRSMQGASERHAELLGSLLEGSPREGPRGGGGG